MFILIDDVWLVVLFSWMFDLEMLTLGHSPLVLMMILRDDSLYQMLTFQRLSCTESLSISRWCIHTGAYPPCWFWHWDSTSCLWLLLSMDHRVVGTLGSVFSAYLVWFGYSLSFVTHLYIHVGLCYTCTHLIRALHLLSPHVSPSYMTLSSYLDQMKIWTSLELSSWVFTRLWTLGSTSSVMVGPVRLLMYLWWYSHDW